MQTGKMDLCWFARSETVAGRTNYRHPLGSPVQTTACDELDCAWTVR